MMTSVQIEKIVSDHFKCDITKTRKARFIYMRSICNVLCRLYTKECTATIGEYYNADHATILHSVKLFYSTYITQKKPFNVLKEFNFLNKYVQEIILEGHLVIDDFDYRELFEKLHEQLIKNIVLNKLNDELYNTINEMKNKSISQDNFDYIRKELVSFTEKDMDELVTDRIIPFKKMILCRKSRLNKVS
jgi:hypothetical protein